VQPFAEAFGKSLGPAMREGLKYVKAFVNGLQGGSAGGGGLIVTLNEIGGAIRRFVQGLLQIGQGPGGGVLSFVKSLKSAFDTIFPAVRNFVATIMPTLTDFGQRLVSLVGPALRSIGNIIKSELAPAIAGILPVLAPVAKFLLGVLGDMVIGVLGGVINVIKGVLRVLAGLLTFLTGVFTGDWSKAWDGIKKIAQGVWDVLQGAFKILINVGFVKALRLGGTLLVKLAGKIWPAIQRLFDKGLVQVAFIVGRGVGVVLNFFKRLPGQALGALKGLGSRIASLFRSAWNAAKSAVSAGVNAVLGLVRGLPGKIKAAVGNLGTVLVESGRALIRGLISGITSMVKNLMSTLKGITSKLPDWKGPMSVDMKILEPSGKAVLQGFVAGIRDALPSLRSELESITADLPAMAAPRRAPAVAAAGGGVTYVFNGRNIDIDEKTIGPVLHAMQLRSRMRRPS
jgi:phage-related protein